MLATSYLAAENLGDLLGVLKILNLFLGQLYMHAGC